MTITPRHTFAFKSGARREKLEGNVSEIISETLLATCSRLVLDLASIVLQAVHVGLSASQRLYGTSQQLHMVIIHLSLSPAPTAGAYEPLARPPGRPPACLLACSAVIPI